MPMVAKQEPYTLFIVKDNNALNPREVNNNLGNMACFHKCYALGDDLKYSTPKDFLRNLCYKSLIIEKEGNLDNSSLNWTDIPDLLEVAKKYNIILPLYLYDHSGITINTTGFPCSWDSCQVGWIYASHNSIKKEYGNITQEILEKVENVLRFEVMEYDLYLTDQCYGFKLYNGDIEIKSCWGFLSSSSDIGETIKEHLPKECQSIVDFLEYIPDNIDQGNTIL